jgi:rod shape determining protein RodA
MLKGFLSGSSLAISLSAIALTSLGILIIFSVDPSLALEQLIFAAIGVLIFILVGNFDYRVLSSFTFYLLLISVILLLSLFLIGLEVRGATRWFDLGFFRFQPSELIKPFLIIILATVLSKKGTNRFSGFFLSLLVSIFFAILIFKQPDLGNAIVFLAIWLGMVIASSSNFIYLALTIFAGFFAVPFVWFHMVQYQKERLLTFLNPSGDPLGTGYNIAQATIAIGSGTLLGKGFGHGTQSHLKFLPAQTTDFVFATFAEELGFLGVAILLSISIFLIYRCLRAAQKTTDLLGSLIIIGVVTLILFQTVINVAMNLGLVPVVGITLPFISEGGSSLISTFFSLGLVVSVIRFSPKTLT